MRGFTTPHFLWQHHSVHKKNPLLPAGSLSIVSYYHLSTSSDAGAADATTEDTTTVD